MAIDRTHSFRSMNLSKVRFLDRVKNVDPALAERLRNLKLDWYKIKNEVAESGGETNTEIFIYDEIGGSAGVQSDQFVQDLQDIDSDSITVRINSPGGSVYDAIAMYNALVQHPATVRTRVDALAASAASVIAMAADPFDAKTNTGGIEMMNGSQMMIHDVIGMEQGNAKDFREMASWLDKQSDNIANIYARRMKGDAQEIRGMMLAETWLFDQEAVDLGFADTLYIAPPMTGDLPLDEEEPDGDEPEEGEEEPEEEDSEEAINSLMGRRHRLTNRGYRYAGRNKAIAPSKIRAAVKNLEVPKSVLDFDEIETFLSALENLKK